MFHEHLGLKTECNFPSAWFNKFKKPHGLRILNICEGKVSMDNVRAESYREEFSNIISDGQYSPDLVYNTDESELLWKYIARKIYTTAEENAWPVIQNCKEWLMVLACSNAVGAHKCKWLATYKTIKPKALNELILTVFYQSNKHVIQHKKFLKNRSKIILYQKQRDTAV